ncbi:hypothetical protein CCUS01_12551 [Colletotrichum cuscutae]|uniref:Uncharacterized protein n=1 Tax=Colletotrichum cuscutae TaxID=1209917 RepID=A0AAI9TTU8_9PEZI|nr:hypothetical protein CCUS01_12551 [Colletotrichum cuscutae]
MVKVEKRHLHQNAEQSLVSKRLTPQNGRQCHVTGRVIRPAPAMLRRKTSCLLSGDSSLRTIGRRRGDITSCGSSPDHSSSDCEGTVRPRRPRYCLFRVTSSHIFLPAYFLPNLPYKRWKSSQGNDPNSCKTYRQCQSPVHVSALRQWLTWRFREALAIADVYFSIYRMTEARTCTMGYGNARISGTALSLMNLRMKKKKRLSVEAFRRIGSLFSSTSGSGFLDDRHNTTRGDGPTRWARFCFSIDPLRDFTHDFSWNIANIIDKFEIRWLSTSDEGGAAVGIRKLISTLWNTAKKKDLRARRLATRSSGLHNSHLQHDLVPLYICKRVWQCRMDIILDGIESFVTPSFHSSLIVRIHRQHHVHLEELFLTLINQEAFDFCSFFHSLILFIHFGRAFIFEP